MGNRAILAGSLLAIAVAAGCETGKVETDEPEAGASASEVRTMLAQSEAGHSEEMDQIAAQFAEMRSLYAASSTQPDFLADIAVAMRLTGRLSSEAGKQHTDTCKATLSRLRAASATLVATAPAREIQQHLERAEISLARGDLQAAGKYVLAAGGTAYNPSAPALVPDLEDPLKKVAAAAKAGDPAKTLELIEEIVTETEKDPTVKDLTSIHLTVIEAEESLRRKAWPILIAQTAEISKLLASVEKRATPDIQTADEEEEEDAAAEEDDAEDAAEPDEEEPEEEEASAETTDEEPEADEPEPST